MNIQNQSHSSPLTESYVKGGALIRAHRELLRLPRYNLNSRQLCDLEMLLNGSFSPVKGFLTKEEYDCVVESMRLPSGVLWPMPIILDLRQKPEWKSGERIALCDEYGKPIAILTVSSIYFPNKEREALKVYGTKNSDHFGVQYLFHQVGQCYVGGSLEGVGKVERFDFLQYRHTPIELREIFRKMGWKRVVGFQTRNPLHRAHVALMQQAAREHKANILIHPSVGLTKDGDIDYITRVRCYSIVQKQYLKRSAFLSLLPLAMRMAGPREALWHAIIRKNYGCTHFIIGRDHAGPGKDRHDNQFYEPYEAQEFVKKYESELGITIIPFQEMLYSLDRKEYIPKTQFSKSERRLSLSGTQLRKKLIDGKPIPSWFTYSEVVRELRRGLSRQYKDGLTVFFTGLPSAGKSTLAKLLYFRLLELQDKKVTLLDGDIVRQNLSKGLGFSREDRIENIQRIGFVASEITKHRGIAICSAVAPHEEARQRNRELISKVGTYLEIFVSTGVSVCKKRDVKGLYKKAQMGLIKGFTGIDDPYETPQHPDITIDTSHKTPDECVGIILSYIKKFHLIDIHPI